MIDKVLVLFVVCSNSITNQPSITLIGCEQNGYSQKEQQYLAMAMQQIPKKLSDWFYPQINHKKIC